MLSFAIALVAIGAGSAFAGPASKLEDAGYLSTEKTGNGVASRTSVALSHRGRAALDAYTAALRGLLAGS